MPDAGCLMQDARFQFLFCQPYVLILQPFLLSHYYPRHPVILVILVMSSWLSLSVVIHFQLLNHFTTDTISVQTKRIHHNALVTMR